MQAMAGNGIEEVLVIFLYFASEGAAITCHYMKLNRQFAVITHISLTYAP